MRDEPNVELKCQNIR